MRTIGAIVFGLSLASCPFFTASAQETDQRATCMSVDPTPTQRVEACTTLLLVSPNDAELLHHRGNGYEDGGDRARALADFEQAARLSPSNATYHNDICWNLALQNRDLSRARAACDEALRLRPGDADIIESRALVAYKDGRFQDAWNDFNAALTANRIARYLFARGVSGLRLGRTAEGQNDIDVAVRVSPQVTTEWAEFGLAP